MRQVAFMCTQNAKRGRTHAPSTTQIFPPDQSQQSEKQRPTPTIRMLPIFNFGCLRSFGWSYYTLASTIWKFTYLCTAPALPVLRVSGSPLTSKLASVRTHALLANLWNASGLHCLRGLFARFRQSPWLHHAVSWENPLFMRFPGLFNVRFVFSFWCSIRTWSTQNARCIRTYPDKKRGPFSPQESN